MKEFCINFFNKLILVFLLFGVFESIKSQDFSITNFSMKEGLSCNSIHKCFQGEDGFLWVATMRGLVRFDGKNFKQFGLKSGLRSTEVLHVNALQNGLIGFYIDGCFLKTKDGKFLDFKQSALNRINANNHLFNEVIDSTLLLTTLDSIYFFDAKTLDLKQVIPFKLAIPIKNEKQKIEFIGMKSILNLVIKKEEQVDIKRWYSPRGKEEQILLFSATKGWVCLFNKSTKTTQLIFHNQKSIVSCYLSSDSFLYNCTAHGLEIIDLNTGKKSSLLRDVFINAVYEDNQGTIWASSQTEGLFRIKKTREILLHKNFTKSFLVAFSFIKNNHQIIFGSRENSFTTLDFKGQTKTVFFKTMNFPNRVIAIVPFQNNLLFFTDNFVEDNHAKTIAFLGCVKSVNRIDSDKVLVSNCNQTGIYSLSQKKIVNTIWTGRTLTNLYTKKGGFLLGTTSGLYFKKSSNSKADTILLEAGKDIGISVIKEDSAGRILVGTKDWGLYILDKNFHIIAKFNAENGLESDHILSLFLDSQNRIWVGTDKGIVLIKENDRNLFETYTPFADIELLNSDINNLLVENDSVYFTTEKEFVHCLFKEHKIVPNFRLNVSSISSKDSLLNLQIKTLPPSLNSLKIKLESPTINSTKEPIYYYSFLKANQTDTIWNKSNSNLLLFNDLNAGSFQLLLKAQDGNNKQIESNIIQWNFTIQQYFYKTLVFKTIIFLLLLSGVLLLFNFWNKRNQRKMIANLAIDAKISELKLQGLLAQMNPHFVFNSLNVIQKFITSKDDLGALNHLSNFSQMMREILNQTRRGTISLEDEIIFLEKYVALEKPRFENNFSFFCHNKTGEDLSEIKIPPMLLQPLVENAIKHGVANMPFGKGEIHLTLQMLNATFLEIIIMDNGISRNISTAEKTVHTSHALNIIKERVELIKKNNLQGIFKFEILPIGAVATIKIPI